MKNKISFCYSGHLILTCLMICVRICATAWAQPADTPVTTATATETAPATSADAPKPQAKPLTVNDILDNVKKRFAGPGVTAHFYQESTIKAMEITDTAEGKLFIKRPDKMRWVYKLPEKQVILTDGNMLWVHRPEDNQVMTGNAPDYFGDGKGASFLSDIRTIRHKFDVSLEKPDTAGNSEKMYRLKLVPKEKKLDISYILLDIDRNSFGIHRITTYNSFDDETIITLKDIQYNQKIDNTMFEFTVPKGADIVQLEQ